MSMGDERLKIVSANTRGLRQYFKRFDYFKNLNSDIICLQETHLTAKDINMLSKEWNIEYFIAGNSTNSRGVSILIKNTFEYKVKTCLKDLEGRFIILELEIVNLVKLALINIYAPNNDDPKWFESIFEKVNKLSLENEIWVGDWNVALEPIDTYNYPRMRNPNANASIKKYISGNSLIDIWRTQNPEKKRYSWKSTNPCKRSRLDYYLISEDLLSLDPKADILNAYRSDHNIISLTF